MNEEEKKKEQQTQQQAQQGKTPASTTAHVDNNGAAVPVTAPAPTPAPSPTANDLQQRLYGNRLTGSNEATRSYDATNNTAPAVPAPDNIKAPEARDPYHLDELAQKINSLEQDYQPLTQEDLERERKKKKREAIFSALGDGLSALSNLYFTTRGAANAYNPAHSLSAKAKERWDKARADRELQKDKYLAYLHNERALAEKRKLSDDALALQAADRQEKQIRRNEDVDFRERKFEYEKRKDAKTAQDTWERFEKNLQFKKDEGSKNRAARASEGQKNREARMRNRTSSRDPHTTEWYELKVGEIYDALDPKYKKDAGEPIMDDLGRRVIGHKRPSVSEMKVIIGQAMNQDPEVKKLAERMFTRGAYKSADDSDEDWSEYETGSDSGDDWSQYEQ